VLDSVGEDNLLVEQLVIVIHLVPGPASCCCHSAVSKLVKALTQADENRF
jgi:hypothetical protein